MITRVFVWRPTVLDRLRPSSSARSPRGWSWGHASGAVLDPARPGVPHLYWSYWPDEKVPGRCVYSYAEDLDVMGRKPCAAIDVPGLDPAAMEVAWAAELEKEFRDLRHNCCTVTHEVLSAGYRARLFSSPGSFAEGCWQSVKASVTRPIQTGLGIMAGAQGQVVADPDAVEKFARHLRNLCGA